MPECQQPSLERVWLLSLPYERTDAQQYGKGCFSGLHGRGKNGSLPRCLAEGQGKPRCHSAALTNLPAVLVLADSRKCGLCVSDMDAATRMIQFDEAQGEHKSREAPSLLAAAGIDFPATSIAPVPGCSCPYRDGPGKL
jgi:hypothetical protein